LSRGVPSALQELDYDIAAWNIETRIGDFEDDTNIIDCHTDGLAGFFEDFPRDRAGYGF